MAANRGRPKSEHRQRILDMLGQVDSMTTREVAHELGINRPRAYYFLLAMEKEGLLERQHLGPITILWCLPEIRARGSVKRADRVPPATAGSDTE